VHHCRCRGQCANGSRRNWRVTILHQSLLREGLPEGKPTAADLTRFIEIDTVDANRVLGFDDDERDYGVAVRMLQMLGCTRVRLMTSNPSKLDGLARAGIDVFGRVPLHGPINADNRRYLAAKATHSGHQLDHVLSALAEADGIPRTMNIPGEA